MVRKFLALSLAIPMAVFELYLGRLSRSEFIDYILYPRGVADGINLFFDVDERIDGQPTLAGEQS